MTEYGNLSFPEAIALFRDKLSMASDTWQEVQKATHDAVFVIAGATEEDLIFDIRQQVDKARADGMAFNKFKSEFRNIVKRRGWQHNGSTAWRAGVIYDTNIRQSYNGGRHVQLRQFEYWQYEHSDSLNPRPHHKAKDGLVLPKDSPFWQTWYPANGWGCKCKVYGISKSEFDRRGLKVSKEPVIETYKYVDKVTGEESWVPIGIDPGFDYAPGATSHAERVKLVQDQKRYRRLIEAQKK